MKTFRFHISLLSLLFASLAAATTNKNNTSHIHEALINGSRIDLPLKWNEVENARQSIWNQWKSIVRERHQDFLISLTPLSEQNKGQWNLPEELEPNATMPYYYGSKGERPQEGYPLMVYLHGSGPKNYEWNTGYKLATGFIDAPSAYFIPQIPNEGKWYRWWQRAKQYAWEKLLTEAFVSEDIDPYRLYMYGISEGGYGSQRLASFYADYFAGFGPMAGGEPLKNAPAENLSNVAFSLRTGDHDFGFYRNELTGVTKVALDSLQKLYPNEFRHDVTLVEGRGHGIPYGITPTWLRQFRRNPYPKHFLWEDYDMDGTHRKGFYNLATHEADNFEPSMRTRYEMTIEDNNISISVHDITYQCTEVDPRFGIEKRFSRSYSPTTRKLGLTIYLCNQLVDFTKPITVSVNNKLKYKGKVKPNLNAMTSSLLCWGDPLRIYPVAIDVEVGN